jgi:tetratricopeptide (TPR) repeat protein
MLSHGAALRPGDRAIVETALAALAADPFADAPFAELARVYESGPGLVALSGELQKRPPRAATAIVLGRVELRRGRRSDAARELRRALDPPLGQSLGAQLARRLALLLDQVGDPEGAIRAYTLGLDGAGPVEARGLRLRLGALYLGAGKVAEARAAWDVAKKSAPGDQALRRRIAEALAARGFFREAIAELAEIEPLIAGQPAAHLEVLRREADFARRSGDPRLAGKLLIDAFLVAASASQERLEDELSRTLRARYPGKEADTLRRLVEERVAREPLAGALLGDLLVARDRPRAVAAYRRVLAVRAGDRYVLRQLATLGHGDERIRDLEELVHLEPTDAKLAGELLVALFDAKRESDALACARAIRARFPDNPVVLFDLGDLLSRYHQAAEALPVYERVVALDGARPEYLVALGDTLRALGRKADAIQAYFRLVGPAAGTASYLRLVKILDERSEPAEAKRAFRAAVDKAPDDVSLRRNFAEWLTRAGSLTEARDEWQRVRDQSKDPFVKAQAAHALDKIQHQLLFNQ